MKNSQQTISRYKLGVIVILYMLFGCFVGYTLGTVIQERKDLRRMQSMIDETRQILEHLIKSQKETDAAVNRALQGSNESLYLIHKLKEQGYGVVQ